MKFPSMPREGKPVEKTVKDMLGFLRAKSIISVKGGRLKESPNGTTIEIPTPPPFPDFVLPPLWVSIHRDSEAEEWKYTVEPGYAIEQNIGSSAKVAYHTPSLGGTSLEDDPSPVGTIPGNACFIYLRVTTSSKGVVAGVTITDSTSAELNTHHIPPYFGFAGQGGDYFFLLAEFEELEGDTLDAPGVLRRLPGNKHIPNQLIQINNVGTGLYLARDYDSTSDAHNVRSIRQSTDSNQQIAVTLNGPGGDNNTIVVDGNDQDGSLTWTPYGGSATTVLEWQDGLVTSSGVKDITLPDFGAAIPDGDQGDMLYWDAVGGAWVLLDAPAVPGSTEINIMTHNGVIPAWETKDIETISVCVAGTPTDWDIIKL